MYSAELVRVTTEKVRTIKDQIKVVQDRHKKYSDVRRRPFEFNAGDQVFLKVALWKNMLQFHFKTALIF